MQLFTLEERGRLASPADFNSTVGAIDACFADGWRTRRDDLVQLTGRLADDHAALRHLLATTVEEGIWPEMGGGRSFWIRRTPAYYLRINLWHPQAGGAAGDKQARYEAIGDCHNHSFDFFTTVVFGPGYTSGFLRQVGPTDTRYVAGDIIPVEHSEAIWLRPGDVMSVDRDVDFHTQEWPEGFTVTLNLVPVPEPGASARQYLIEEATGLVKMVVDGRA